MKNNLLAIGFLFASYAALGQNGWTVCNAPAFNGRIDDLVMVNGQTGYAVGSAGGGGQIVKTIDGGNNWTFLKQEAGVHLRSVEFFNTEKGFVGGFTLSGTKIFQKTTDGGVTWTDITGSLPAKARKGICGMAVADENTIYAGGAWFEDSGYIAKSTNGGESWSLIDMHEYTSGVIDMHFLNKDTGFVTGMGPEPLRNAVILYTTNGGISWEYKFHNFEDLNAYVWKIQRLNKLVWFASIENFGNVTPRVLKSIDGGMTWKKFEVDASPYNIQGIGFIDPMHGWTGGAAGKSFETKDGGLTWDSIPIIPYMNRVVKLNSNSMLATGTQIWKYNGTGTYPAIPATRYAWLTCYPNPVRDVLTMNVAITNPSRVMVAVYDQAGRRVKVVENADRAGGSYQYFLDTKGFSPGVYHVALKTHEDQCTVSVVVSR
jgi:photosystem II stability/assembly factor-like uncharacterized protein